MSNLKDRAKNAAKSKMENFLGLSDSGSSSSDSDKKSGKSKSSGKKSSKSSDSKKSNKRIPKRRKQSSPKERLKSAPKSDIAINLNNATVNLVDDEANLIMKESKTEIIADVEA